MTKTRLDKSVKNARINLTFYLLVLFVSFFSRRIFLQSLGDDFVGLTSTMLNILNVINLAELGIGSAVGYMLYKPLLHSEHNKISEIISIFGYIYRKIGFIVALIALAIFPFLHLIFAGSGIAPSIIYFSYSSFVVSSLLGYFINYKQLLLGADQRNYEITTYFQLCNVIRLALQIVVAKYTQNYYLWIALEIIFGAIYSIIISRRIAIIYPWLKSNIKNGKELLKSYPQIITNTKQIFIHKLSSVVLTNLSPIFILFYTSTSMVAFYTNYTLIISKLSQLISHLLSSTDAGIGSVVAENDNEKSLRIYWEITSLYYLIAGVVIISLYFLIDPFITIWVGSEYLMNNSTVIIILVNMYLGLVRIGNDHFIYAYGLFSDIWAPITETAINILASVALGAFWGVNGVIFGSALSVILIVGIWKPYFLFRKGFVSSVWGYWKNIAKFVAITVICFIVIYFITKVLAFDLKNSYIWWSIYALIVFLSTSSIMFGAMLLTSKGMRDATRRVKENIISKIRK